MDSFVGAAIEHGKLEKRLYDELEHAEHLRIVVCGVGGGGNNTLNRLSRIGISSAEMIAVNTDKQDLQKLPENIGKVLIGARLMRGLGAGGFPELGQKAAEASRRELHDVLSGTNLIFLVAGMGGGTGTGAAPVIAEIAREEGAIVVAVVTFPFNLERSRVDKAREGIRLLKNVADTVVVVDNNKLVEYVPNLPIDKAFSVADEIAARAVKGITETIMEPSLINMDFADIKAMMTGGSVSVISVGEAEGRGRCEEAVKNTLKQPLLDVDIRGATGALIHITGGPNMTLGEANLIGELMTGELDPKATIMWGARVNADYDERIEIIAILTGVKSDSILSQNSESGYSMGQTEDDLDLGFI
jgi:cell division protein FtsZ